MLEKKRKSFIQKGKVFGAFLCSLLLFSTLTISNRPKKMIFAYNMNNLLRSTTVSEYITELEDHYLISRENTAGHLRIF